MATKHQLSTDLYHLPVPRQTSSSPLPPPPPLFAPDILNSLFPSSQTASTRFHSSFLGCRTTTTFRFYVFMILHFLFTLPSQTPNSPQSFTRSQQFGGQMFTPPIPSAFRLFLPTLMFVVHLLCYFTTSSPPTDLQILSNLLTIFLLSFPSFFLTVFIYQL